MRRIITLAAGLALAVAFAAGAARAAELEMVNETPDPLTLFVDGQQGCSAPPGGACRSQTTLGRHVFLAVTPDGRVSDITLDLQYVITRWRVHWQAPVGEVVVQATRYLNRQRAEAARERLQGFGRIDLVPRDFDGNVLFKVEVRRPTGSVTPADLLAQVRAAGFTDAFVIADN